MTPPDSAAITTPMKRLLLGIAAAAALASPALAHHALAMFDRGQPVTFTGVVKSFESMNPHSWLQVDVVSAGKTTEWALEVEAPSVLARAGIKPADFVVGERVKVVAWPLRDGRPGGSLVSLTRPNGAVLDPRKGMGRTP
jgi:hypothetical protein